MKAFWIVIIIASVILEIITAGLTLIWLGLGACVALIANICGAGFNICAAIFLGVSAFLLYFVRPYSVSFFNRNRKEKHLKYAIGQKVRVIEEVSSSSDHGRVFYNDMEWLATSELPEENFAAGDTAVIKDISGIRLVIGHAGEG